MLCYRQARNETSGTHGKIAFLVDDSLLTLFQEIQGESMDFGIMLEPSIMMCKHRARAKSGLSIKFGLNMKFREIKVEFPLTLQKSRAPAGTSSHQHTEMLRFSIPFYQTQDIYIVPAPPMTLVLFFSLETPPKFFKKLDRIPLPDAIARKWFEGDMWYRQTDITHSPARLKTSPVTLKKSNPILDLGKVLTSAYWTRKLTCE